MIGGTIAAPFYYGFICPEMIMFRWIWLCTTWTFCLICLFLVVFPLKKRQWVNALCWVVAGWSTAGGCIQLCFFPKPDVMIPDCKFWPWVTGGLLYTVGAVAYALKIPERFWRKKFDIVGASHQIFHVFVMAGAGIHFYASLTVFE